ncbi:alpha/beta hydrolase [Rhodococcus sp. D2-41]|uniref:Alpha/beta hydrolase n=1 Tax=Speluncibacter jeojiensis TaxID=2710754 RepID=A0A9X4RD98_9ACTN|nr:alpha/beta hydrolase [Rhodococcus sp. D2-41]MDG3009730.1 alpha/beta hydrolase [Rhodococcus sp. D2-41]MDG3014479.1 alpha/beta hydrolase [Corynebacteriales bacterium D3-21]
MQLAHEIRGEGPTLVLVHGVVHRRHAWNPVLDLLTPHRRVVTVDLPGHGDSPEMPAGADPLRIGTEIAEEFLEQVAPGEKVHVAGNSLGGWFALEMAARGKVASATAISPAGFFANKVDQERAVKTFLALRASARRLGPRMDRMLDSKAGRTVGMGVFFSKPWRVDPEIAKIDSRALLTNKVIDRGLSADFTFSPLADPMVPITVAWGKRDLVLPVYEAKRVRQVFPQARVTAYPKVGHVPMSDDPQLIARVLLEGSATTARVS